MMDESKILWTEPGGREPMLEKDPDFPGFGYKRYDRMYVFFSLGTIPGLTDAFGSVKPGSKAAKIDYIRTYPQGRGVGRYVVGLIEKFARKLGAIRITGRALQGSEDFWRKMGYSVVYIRGGGDVRAKIEKMLTRNPTLRFPVKSPGQLAHLFEAQKHLAKAGVGFDAGSSLKGGRVATRDWELDWSLRGARLENPYIGPGTAEIIKSKLVAGAGSPSWRDFVDGGQLGDCQYIVSQIRKMKLPGVVAYFGHIRFVAPLNERQQKTMTHHWVTINKVPYEFSKGSLRDFVGWDDIYGVEDDGEVQYKPLYAKTDTNPILAGRHSGKTNPDHRTRTWQGFTVDADLEDRWLEDVNRIPGFEVNSVCSGHYYGAVLRAHWPAVGGLIRGLQGDKDRVIRTALALKRLLLSVLPSTMVDIIFRSEPGGVVYDGAGRRRHAYDMPSLEMLWNKHGGHIDEVYFNLYYKVPNKPENRARIARWWQLMPVALRQTLQRRTV